MVFLTTTGFNEDRLQNHVVAGLGEAGVRVAKYASKLIGIRISS